MSEYHQITLNEWIDMKNRLRRELNDLRTSFVRVGYILRKMEDSKAYEAEGYKSVAEFALKEHGLQPSTTSRWMAINREYSIDGYSEQLDPRYLDMNASQLTEMLTLPDKDRELVTPETPRAEIRELKRFNADAAAADAQAAPKEESPSGKAFEMLLASDASTAEAVKSCLEHGLADAKHLFDAVAPSGSRMFRAGTVFLVFNQLNIMVKVFGGASSSVSYEEFAETASAWFAEHARPEEQEEELPAEETAAEPEEMTEPEEAAEPEETAEPEESALEPEKAAAEPAKKPAAKKENKPKERQPAPPVDMNPPVAPAQKPEEVIVDEAGNPAPEDPEETERKRLEQVEIHRDSAETLLASLNQQVTAMDWPSARETAESLLAALIFLQENDLEAIDALVKRITGNDGQ